MYRNKSPDKKQHVDTIGVLFLFYKLTGKTKEEIHAAVVEQRKQFEAGEPAGAEAEG